MYWLHFSSAGFLICWLIAGNHSSTLTTSIFSSETQENNLQTWIKLIDEQRSFDTLLIAYVGLGIHSRLENLLVYPWPKVFLTPAHGFGYKEKYNSEILVLITMSHQLDKELMEVTASALNSMRSARVLMMVLDIENEEDFRNTTLSLCQKYKMTNVLLKFLYQLSEQCSSHYYQLRPYPMYHWLHVAMDHPSTDYYPQHWRNMQKGVIVTQSDQAIPRCLFYLDARGELKINGYVARLILLFAQHFNATLQWYSSLRIGEVTHYMAVNKLVDDNVIDMPMTMIVSGASPEWLHRSYIYQIENGRIIVPCAQQLSLQEVFSVLLDVHYIFDGIQMPMNALLSDRVFPAVLGQSFVARNSPWRVLKLVYILLSFLGLNITCQFSATMNSLFITSSTTPIIDKLKLWPIYTIHP
ncbi:uncharacterized protein LOC131996232 [Stomoxys calcitrans]|uniref:uncharacterized protein LOC131996232 n=1 Tax=Stomoxys calcitrans TaxID=35570 RepID=UPI0027E37630|nr:uncharacterized protein LOC131996232 [Stomoxys calcitrans]